MNKKKSNENLNDNIDDKIIDNNVVDAVDDDKIVENEILENHSNLPQDSQPKAKRSKVAAFFGTIGNWFKRSIMGSSKDIDKFVVERLESPGKTIVKNFFSKRLAVIALIIILIMFLTVFIAPFFLPLDLAYNEPSQKNTKPGYAFMSIPNDLSKDIKAISSNSTFSVGLSNAGKIYVWGNTKDKLVNIDMKKLPDSLTKSKILFAQAGFDHAIAITEEGKVVGWGAYDNGQYGDKGSMVNYVIKMPDVLLNGKIDANQVNSLTCGNQVSAIVMKDGTTYMWGNNNQGAVNMKQIMKYNNVEEIAFTGSAAIALLKDGTIVTDGITSFDKIEVVVGEGDAAETIIVPLQEYINGRKVVDIATTNSTVALILEDDEVIVTGTKTYGEGNVPKMESGERIVSISGGTKHYSIATSLGKIYSWGSNGLNQTKVPSGKTGASVVFTGPYQSYAVSDTGKLVAKWGLKGYLMGTDEFGRDIFNRVINGGKMTMTIGAVAVIISSIIGVIIGCLSGYFGGWIDMLLMRITEIFSAIPFLPFALILSAVLKTSNIQEDARIFLIMVILGLLSWTGLARLVRGQVLAEREKEFVIAAKAMGVKESKIAFRHILPNIISVIIVTMTLDFAGCMLTESTLSYLGFGVQLPRPTWGNMLNGCNNSIVIQQYWWRWLFPGMALGIATVCINIIGDALRDVMDPKSSADR